MMYKAQPQFSPEQVAVVKSYRKIEDWPKMREAATKCTVALFILSIWLEKLFCGEFSPVIFAFARCT